MIRTKTLIVTVLLLGLFFAECVFAGSASIEQLAPSEAPAGWRITESPVVLKRETLFEHINGEADLFVQYGFRESVFAILRNKNAPDDKVDIDIYDMGNTLQAFGIFSRFRQGENPAGIGLDSYLKERYALFYKDRYFVILQSTQSNEAILREIATSIESRIKGNTKPPQEIAYFSVNGIKPGSIEYYPDGLLGLEFLGRGFKATYSGVDSGKSKLENPLEPQEFNIFISIFPGSTEASQAFKNFRSNLSGADAKTVDSDTATGLNTLLGSDPYQGKTLVIHKGSYLLGAVGFQSYEAAKRVVSELVARLP